MSQVLIDMEIERKAVEYNLTKDEVREILMEEDYEPNNR